MGIGILIRKLDHPKVYIHIIDTETGKWVAVKSISFKEDSRGIAFRNLESKRYSIAVTTAEDSECKSPISLIVLELSDGRVANDIITATVLLD